MSLGLVVRNKTQNNKCECTYRGQSPTQLLTKQNLQKGMDLSLDLSRGTLGSVSFWLQGVDCLNFLLSCPSHSNQLGYILTNTCYLKRGKEDLNHPFLSKMTFLTNLHMFCSVIDRVKVDHKTTSFQEKLTIQLQISVLQTDIIISEINVRELQLALKNRL